jgi:hypothetical protein
MKGERKLRHKLQLLWTDLKAGAALMEQQLSLELE